MSIELLRPYAQIKIGDDVFQSGDGLLKNWSVTLCENSGGSVCEFSIYDPGRKFVDKYLKYIEEIQGLVPAVINRDKESKKSGSSGSGKGKPFNGSLSGDISGFDQNRIKQAIEFYRGEGLTDQGIAMLLGNMMQESSLNPSAVGTDQGTGFAASEGLIQWTFERKEGMPSDFEGQLAFTLEEIERDGLSPGLVDKLKDPSVSLEDLKQPVEDWIRWGDLGSRFDYAQSVLDSLASDPQTVVEESADKVKTPDTQPKKTVESETGQQITVGLGFNGKIYHYSSYLHTGLTFDVFGPDTLTFTGQAAAWVMAQQKKNTAYQNLTFKDLAEKITGEYGLKLEMSSEGPTYEYFQQKGETDFDTLLLEAQRLGFLFSNVGSLVKIDEKKYEAEFILRYADNLGMNFKVSHQAEGDSSGGARSSDPSQKSTTGQKKFNIDPATGELIQEQLEDSAQTTDGTVGTEENSGNSQQRALTTGYHLSTIKPIEQSSDDDKQTRTENAKRVKGILAEFKAPTSPQILELTPDTAFETKGFSTTIDRFWVVESVTHSGGVNQHFETVGRLYSPLKNKFPSTSGSDKKGSKGKTAKKGEDSSASNPGGFIVPTGGVLTSPYGPRGGRLHAGVDIAAGEGDPVYASAAGTVIDVQDGCVIGDGSCGGGYGNLVEIDHGNGYTSFYAHLSNGSVAVAIGDEVTQGQQIAGQSDTGSSRGVHLHFEIRESGVAVDPENFITIPR